MRLDFEVNGMGWKRLHKKYTVPASTIRVFAREQGWERPTPAKDLETAILATGLRSTTIAGQELDEMPPNPSMADVVDEQASPEPTPEPVGEDELPDTPNSPAEPLETPIHQSANVLPQETDPGPPAPELVFEPVRNGDATPAAEAPVAAPDPEPEPEPKAGKIAPKLVEKIHEVQPDEPLSEGANWLKGKKPDPPKSADIINFPRAPAEPARGATVVHFLPEQLGEEKTRLRVTLAAIKGMMTLEQVQQLEHHEALLRRYSHLIEVYLEPMRFVDVEGLDDDMKAEKIVATQRLAMQMLLPTERDTLAGAFKVLTEAIRSSIVLKRAVVGLHPVKGGATMPSRDPMFRDDPETDAEVKKLLDVSTLDTGQLRHVQQAMEMLQRHQHRQNAAPKPPDPDPIEDLRNPDYVAPETDPEMPR